MREKIQTFYSQFLVARSRTKSSVVGGMFILEGGEVIVPLRKDPQVTEKDHEMVKVVCRAGRQPFQRWQSAGIRLVNRLQSTATNTSKDDRHKSTLPLLVQKTINHRRSQNCKSSWWCLYLMWDKKGVHDSLPMVIMSIRLEGSIQKGCLRSIPIKNVMSEKGTWQKEDKITPTCKNTFPWVIPHQQS